MAVKNGESRPEIRPIAADDWSQWCRIWRAYLEFYGTDLPSDVYETSFARLVGSADGDFSGLVACVDGDLVGVAHYLFHRHGWKHNNVCYLQDLYVAPDQRGTGLGRKLIEAVYAVADTAGAPDVYWLTQSDNHAGRALYDRVGVLTDFIKYQRPAI